MNMMVFQVSIAEVVDFSTVSLLLLENRFYFSRTNLGYQYLKKAGHYPLLGIVHSVFLTVYEHDNRDDCKQTDEDNKLK